eukprot:CAMPEP_0116908936 /NCGR_PEP_ID=MMETSP0467-20121206/13977_1 /TAXON_ID=283647 /ORGANISM="Mesodinium pulex, Strain SPMC105" /LENGTH=80 /DNA_ID=CAMNT_0004584199 /DNA_START=665 /DNA_END=907 /DNA_ORIENTATION=+
MTQVDEACITMVQELISLMNSIEETPAILHLSNENRAKYNNKKEEAQKKEELGVKDKKRTDKELEIYNKRKMKKHTKMVK